MRPRPSGAAAAAARPAESPLGLAAIASRSVPAQKGREGHGQAGSERAGKDTLRSAFGMRYQSSEITANCGVTLIR